MGGALRSTKFVKYLPEFGWETCVFTLEIQKKTIENTGAVIRIPSATPYQKPYQVTPYGWAFNVYQYGKTFLKKHPVNLIYVTCPPFPQLVAALLLKKRLKCPLIVDFRDAWSLDPYTEGSRLKRFLYKKVFPLLEKKVLLSSDVFIANTPSMQQSYQAVYPFLKGKTVLIPNGYDEDDFKNIKLPATPNQVFTLIYCGSFGIGGRDPKLLFQTIKTFIEQKGCVLQLKIIGDDSALIRQYIKALNLNNVILVIGVIPHPEAITYMHQADALVLYQENTKAKVSAIAGKTYEYLRIGKPILAIVPPGDNLDIVKQYAPRYEAVTDYTEATLFKSISHLYTEWKKGLLHASSMPQQAYIENYNRRYLTSKLIQVFDSTTKKTI
jgi:glycosyltransferase involved in cell wall biosynthesis